MNAVKVRLMLASGYVFDLTAPVSDFDVDLLLKDSVVSITAKVDFEPRPLTKALYTKALV